MHNEELAHKVAEDRRYTGGYAYPGTTWWPEELKTAQTMVCSKSGIFPGDYDAALRFLEDAPEGTKVYACNFYGEDGRSEDTYTKTADGQWTYARETIRTLTDEESDSTVENA